MFGICDGDATATCSGLGCSDAAERGRETNRSCVLHARYTLTDTCGEKSVGEKYMG